MKIAGRRDLRAIILLSLNEVSARFLSSRGEERLGEVIGRVAYTIFRRRRRLITSGLAGVFGSSLASGDISRIAKRVLRNEWVGGFSLSAARKNPSQRVVLDGLEHVHTALSRGKGLILLESPFGKRLLGKAVLAQKGFILSQLHAKQHGGPLTWLGQTLIRRMFRTIESKFVHEIIDIDEHSLAYLRLLINRLNQNGIICISGVGRSGRNHVPDELAGVEVLLPTGPFSLARMSGAAIIPLFCFTDDDGVERLTLETPIRLDGSDRSDEALVQGVRQYARLLEAYIGRYPDQWYLWHRASGVRRTGASSGAVVLRTRPASALPERPLPRP